MRAENTCLMKHSPFAEKIISELRDVTYFNLEISPCRIGLVFNINIYLQDDFGKTAAHYAAQYGNTAALAFLCELDNAIIHAPAKTQFEESDSKQTVSLKEAIQRSTHLHPASPAGKTATVQWLLDHGANLEARTENAETAVEIGMQSQAGNDIRQLFQPFTISKITEVRQQAIVESIQQDNVDAMIALMEGLVPCNVPIPKKHTALHLASLFGAMQCSAWLLKNASDPMLRDPDSRNAPEIAAAKGSYGQLSMMRDRVQPDIDAAYSQGKTLLHHAAENGRFLNVLALLQSGASLNLSDLFGFTPLHLATEGHGIKTIRFLLALGANDHLKTEFHKTAEEIADPDAIRKIFSEHKRLKLQCDFSQTPLHFTVRSKNIWGTKILAAVRDVNAQDSHGMTPLHIAVKEECLEIILTLLRYGADPGLKNNSKRDLPTITNSAKK